MPMRATEASVSLKRSFTLIETSAAGRKISCGDRRRGDFRDVVSSLSLRRDNVAPPFCCSGGRKQMVPIDADDLRAALTADGEN